MRIISGFAKGQRVQTLKGSSVRPTSDRVRESIFNIVGSAILDTRVLDLFAGFGAFGLEAISRGANFVTFVEKSRSAAQIIQANLDRLGFDNGKVIINDVFRFFRVSHKNQEKFNVVFADPPYKIFDEHWIGDLWKGVSNLMKDQGLFIVEHPSKWRSSFSISNFELSDSRTYGQTTVSFYTHASALS
jgi:16S rRNA (guanine(966)-N(2))-methyltransferase RsmD